MHLIPLKSDPAIQMRWNNNFNKMHKKTLKINIIYRGKELYKKKSSEEEQKYKL